MMHGIIAWQPSGPPAANVTLLLHMDGANGSTSFPDNSLSPKTVTPSGDAQISTAQSKFGGSSAVFDGNGDYLSSSGNADFDFGAGDFTIEFFVRLEAYSDSYSGNYGAAIVSTYRGSGGLPAGWQVRINGTSSSFTTVNVYTGSTDLNFSASFALSTWYHVAVCRVAGQLRVFVDGVQAGPVVSNTDSFDGSASGSRPLMIGSLNDATFKFYLNGYLDEMRLTKGTGWYTADFTPPVAPFPNP